MGNAQSQVYDFRAESNFRVLVNGVPAGEFTKAGPLMKGKVDVMAMRGGGSLTPLVKRPGNADFESVTLERGSSSDQLLRLWWEEVCNNGGIAGENSPTYLRQVRIEQLDRDKTTVLCSWTYDDAFPEEFDMGGFDAESNKFRMEMVKFAYTGTPTYKEGDG